MEYNTPYACTKGFFEMVCRRLSEEDKVEANTQIQRGDDDDDVDNPKTWNYLCYAIYDRFLMGRRFQLIRSFIRS